VDEAELVDGREHRAAGVERVDVVDARRERRARRRVEVDGPSAELAEIIGASSELGQDSGSVSGPGAAV
jgi:hypothetical protein